MNQEESFKDFPKGFNFFLIRQKKGNGKRSRKTKIKRPSRGYPKFSKRLTVFNTQKTEKKISTAKRGNENYLASWRLNQHNIKKRLSFGKKKHFSNVVESRKKAKPRNRFSLQTQNVLFKKKCKKRKKTPNHCKFQFKFKLKPKEKRRCRKKSIDRKRSLLKRRKTMELNLKEEGLSNKILKSSSRGKRNLSLVEKMLISNLFNRSSMKSNTKVMNLGRTTQRRPSKFKKYIKPIKKPKKSITREDMREFINISSQIKQSNLPSNVSHKKSTREDFELETGPFSERSESRLSMTNIDYSKIRVRKSRPVARNRKSKFRLKGNFIRNLQSNKVVSEDARQSDIKDNHQSQIIDKTHQSPKRRRHFSQIHKGLTFHRSNFGHKSFDMADKNSNLILDNSYKKREAKVLQALLDRKFRVLKIMIENRKKMKKKDEPIANKTLLNAFLNYRALTQEHEELMQSQANTRKFQRPNDQVSLEPSGKGRQSPYNPSDPAPCNSNFKEEKDSSDIQKLWKKLLPIDKLFMQNFLSKHKQNGHKLAELIKKDSSGDPRKFPFIPVNLISDCIGRNSKTTQSELSHKKNWIPNSLGQMKRPQMEEL